MKFHSHANKQATDTEARRMVAAHFARLRRLRVIAERAALRGADRVWN